MKRVTKQVFSALIAIIMIATSVPFTAFAEEGNTQSNQNVSADMGDMSLTATNPIAEVITDELEKGSAEETADYVITDLKFNDKVATVFLSVVSDCTVVVAIYTEEGQMLATGMSTASSDVDSVDVTVEIESMPEYFVAQAFLLDEDYAPLCPEFTTIEEMQYYEEFMVKSVDDFEADDVIINFDEQKDDNFAVLADGGSAVLGSADRNILVSADYENEIYKFENIDSNISSLSIGDVFYYEYNDEMLIIKVTDIDIKGTSATVTGDKSAELEDYFSFVKVDISTETDGNDFTVDTEGADEGVEYIGTENWEDDVLNDDFNTYASIGDAAEISCPVWKLNHYFAGNGDSSNVRLTGQIKASVEYDIKIHYDPLLLAGSLITTGNPLLSGVLSRNAYKSVKAVFDVKVKGTVTLTGELSKDIFLGTLDFVTPVGIVCSVGFRLAFSLSAAVTFTIAEISQTVGFDYKKDGEIKNLCTKPLIDITPSLSGKLEGSVGLKISPSISLIKVIGVSINPEVGVKAEMTLFDTEGEKIENHLCKVCFDGELKFYVKVKLVGEIFGENIGDVKLTPEYEKHLKDFYYSVTYIEFGWGKCPYSTESDGNGGNNGNGDNNEVGDIVEFGSYPQSEVTDTSLLSALNSLSLSWASYGYYSGTGDRDDGQMQPRDYMKYADVTYKGERYRAVKFTEYRPYYTGYQSSTNYTYQDDNGYYTNTVYWFKFEPLKWRVLDPSEGLVICESIIDSQPYNNTVYYNGSEYFQDFSCTAYANDYAKSTIRDWLNDDFYHTAFTTSEKADIKTTTCNNSSYYTSKYNSATTNDNIFLLSYWDTVNTNYGLSSSYSEYDTARRAQGTDYAKAQGLYVVDFGIYNGKANWWLRTPGGTSYFACRVSFNGRVASSGYEIYENFGVRPALKINLQSSIYQSYGEQSGTVSIETEGEAGLTEYKASKADCVENEEYVLAVLKSGSEISGLTEDALLYIDQKTAESGKVSFTYIPRIDVEADVYIIGPSSSGETVQEKVTQRGVNDPYCEIIGGAMVKTQGGVNYITGLQPSLTKAKFQSTHIDSENVTVEISMTTARYLGTGSTVTVTSTATGEVIAEYVIVIYGDVDGTATINGRDAAAVSNSITGVADSLTGAAKLAANVEGTRATINAKDASVIRSVAGGSMTIDQSTGKGVEA